MKSFWTEDTKPLSSILLWWHSMDSVLCTCVFLLMGLGIWLILAASPAITAHHNWNTFVLIKRHVLLLAPGIFILLTTSLFSKKNLLLSALIIGIIMWGIVWAVVLWGVKIKGARRWISLGGFSLQPSEFLKPATSFLVACILSHPFFSRPWNFLLCLGLMGVVVCPLFFQPDIGMVFLLFSITFGQCFVGGLPWLWVAGSVILAFLASLGTYFCFPHTVHRIQIFFSEGGSNIFGSQYQSIQSVKSIASGGLWGKGPGAGTIVNHLPDSHADFIFAVAGEELGLIMCLLILGCYACIIFRCLWYMLQEKDKTYVLVLLGIMSQLLLQVFLNVGSVLRLIPTKGTTLPFISYGGSSFLSLCWAMGMVLAITRRYRDQEKW